MQKIKLGVIAMEKKTKGKSFRKILDELDKYGDMEFIVMTDKQIQEDPIDQWPVFDALITFYADGYPTDKVIEYVKKVNPILVNDPERHKWIFNRGKIYEVCDEFQIPSPKHIIVDTSKENVTEELDYIEYRGVRLDKPFVEKPLDSERHDIRIMYNSRDGGGCTQIFRRVFEEDGKAKNSERNDNGKIRRDGVFVFEEFIVQKDPVDIKVYAVDDYAYAEMRKPPGEDGKPVLDEFGREVRVKVDLTDDEKLAARKITKEFGQTVCGFDILRRETGGFAVIDINGWSFVKSKIGGEDFPICAKIVHEKIIAEWKKRGN